MSNLMQFVRRTHGQLLKEEADVQLYNCQNSWGDNLSQLVVRHWEQTTCCRNAPILKCESNNEIHWDPGWCSRWIWWLILYYNLSRQEEFYLLNCISQLMSRKHQIFQIFIPSGSTDVLTLWESMWLWLVVFMNQPIYVFAQHCHSAERKLS